MRDKDDESERANEKKLTEQNKNYSNDDSICIDYFYCKFDYFRIYYVQTVDWRSVFLLHKPPFHSKNVNSIVQIDWVL